MKIIFNTLAAILLTVSLSGCIVVGGGDWDRDRHDDWRETQRENLSIINQLEINDSRKYVIEKLGAFFCW